jgi:hypothetical protein
MYPQIPWELVFSVDPKGSAEHTLGTTGVESSRFLNFFPHMTICCHCATGPEFMLGRYISGEVSSYYGIIVKHFDYL